MEKPIGCKDCPELESILSTPVKNFTKNLEEITGQEVDSVGYYYLPRDLTVPNFALLRSGRAATYSERSDAYWKAENERKCITKLAEEQINNCPGMCEATVEIENIGTRSFRVCGKLAIKGVNQEQ